jgi:hypothetical protein
MSKISEMDLAGNLDGGELVPVVQGGQNRKATAKQLGLGSGGVIHRAVHHAFNDGTTTPQATGGGGWTTLMETEVTKETLVDKFVRINAWGPMRNTSGSARLLQMRVQLVPATNPTAWSANIATTDIESWYAVAHNAATRDRFWRIEQLIRLIPDTSAQEEQYFSWSTSNYHWTAPAGGSWGNTAAPEAFYQSLDGANSAIFSASPPWPDTLLARFQANFAGTVSTAAWWRIRAGMFEAC